MQSDFDTHEEIDTTACRIPDCHARVLGDNRCIAHGGQPQLEYTTDMWGAVTWRFGPQEDEK